MKTFNCVCPGRPTLFFESSCCTACNRVTGLTDDFQQVQAFNFDEQSGRYYLPNNTSTSFVKCKNFSDYQACNSMITYDSDYGKTENSTLCFACRFNETIPNLDVNEHLPLWQKMEKAKRRTLYTLKALPLAIKNKQEDSINGLSFDFTTDKNVKDHFASPLPNQTAVFTGHDCGNITINLAEADEVARAKTQIELGEKYRTLLGHFRHEIGHYYFDQLIANDTHKHNLSKQVFGDDGLDYQAALDKHYQTGAPENWRQSYISEYATMHPWEDWAETWAHYMHIVDTLETIQSAGLTLAPSTNSLVNNNTTDNLNLPQGNYYFDFQTPFSIILDTWIQFSIVINSLNRSMGLQDAYPFVLTQPVRDKLTFIHFAIHNKLDQYSQ